MTMRGHFSIWTTQREQTNPGLWAQRHVLPIIICQRCKDSPKVLSLKCLRGTAKSHATPPKSCLFLPIVQAFPLFSQQFQRQDFHQVLFSGESTSLWTISPPSRDLLRQQLNEVTNDPTRSILLQFSWTITRLAVITGSLLGSHTVLLLAVS